MIGIAQPIIEKEEIEAVNAVVRSGRLAQGRMVEKLESVFASYCGTKYAIAVNSGTAAIHAGLYALGVQEGDEVITTPFTFVATANPVLMLGAKVIFADISEKDFNISPAEIERKITQRTKALIPVDLFGQICDFAKVGLIAKKHNLKILEDACQAVGAEQNGKKAGCFGDVGAFSFYATKNIMCGEGGMIVTNDGEVAERCKRFRHHGQSEKTKYEYWDIGYNYRLTDVLAAIAVEQMKKLDKLNRQRLTNAKKLTQGLKGVKGILLPSINEGNKHVFHQYTIRITEECKMSRDDLLGHLKKREIGCGIYYPKPLHLHPHFARLGYERGDFPVAEKMAGQVLSLPVHPRVSEEQLDYIIASIHNYAT